MMRRNLVLTIILASLFSSLITGCTQSTLPEITLAPPQAIPTPSPGTTPTGFFLTVSQPADGSIVDISNVEVTGHTSPEAVVSVNNEITIADTEGTFAIIIILEEGPNIVEVIASDEEGNEAGTSLTLTLVKGG